MHIMYFIVQVNACNIFLWLLIFIYGNIVYYGIVYAL